MRKYKGLRARLLLQQAMLNSNHVYSLFPWQIHAMRVLHGNLTAVFNIAEGIGKTGNIK